TSARNKAGGSQAAEQGLRHWPSNQGGSICPDGQSHEKLLKQLADKHFEQVTTTLQRNILECYADSNADILTKQNKKDWEETLANLDKLRALQPAQDQPITIGQVLIERFETDESPSLNSGPEAGQALVSCTPDMN